LQVWARAGLFDLQREISGLAAQAHFFTIMNGHIASNPASEFHLDQGAD